MQTGPMVTVLCPFLGSRLAAVELVPFTAPSPRPTSSRLGAVAGDGACCASREAKLALRAAVPSVLWFR